MVATTGENEICFVSDAGHRKHKPLLNQLEKETTV